MIGLSTLAWRNFTRHLPRYRILLAALVLVVTVLTIVLGTVLGITHTLRGKASRYFSGSVTLQGYEDTGTSLIEQVDEITEIFESMDADLITYSRRSVSYSGTHSLFHAGYSIPQRRLVGVEWDLEAPVLRNFDFVAGELPKPGNQDAILISSVAAEALNARLGDEIIVSRSGAGGQINTINLIVHGIFAESSFFGYTAYMERRTINRLMNAPQDQVTEMGLYVDNQRNELAAARELLQRLDEQFETFPLLINRQQREDIRAESWEGRRYAVLTLKAQLIEVTDLLDALSIVAGVIIVLFLGILVIGVGNTYSMIVFERTKEIGTLRAIGLQRGRTIGLFMLEAALLGLAGIVIGIGAGILVLSWISVAADFSNYNWSPLFMIQGHLQWRLTPGWLVLVSSIALAAILLGCVRSALSASRIIPVEALRQE